MKTAPWGKFENLRHSYVQPQRLASEFTRHQLVSSHFWNSFSFEHGYLLMLTLIDLYGRGASHSAKKARHEAGLLVFFTAKPRTPSG
jgi:hypothetical protein